MSLPTSQPPNLPPYPHCGLSETVVSSSHYSPPSRPREPSSLGMTSTLLGLPPKAPLELVSAHLQPTLDSAPFTFPQLSSPLLRCSCCLFCPGNISFPFSSPPCLPHLTTPDSSISSPGKPASAPATLGSVGGSHVPCALFSCRSEHSIQPWSLVHTSPENRELPEGRRPLHSSPEPVTWVVLSKCSLNRQASFNQEGRWYSTSPSLARKAA